jgi:hypothetical protein
MIAAMGASLPMSVGVALSPVPIAAVMLLMLTARARANARSFLLGWMLGILTVSTIVLLLPGLDTSQGAPTVFSGYFKIALGIILLLMSIQRWRLRPAPDAHVDMPPALTGLDQFGPLHSLAAGFLLSGVNPKNLILVVAGANTIDASLLPPAQQIIVLLVFTVIASITVGIPVFAHILFRNATEAMFGDWKNWLIRNNVVILASLFLMFGALLIGDGLSIIAA